MNKNIVVYFVTEHGRINFNYNSTFMKILREQGFVIEDFGMGSAYNMPIYLLGEVEENIEKAVVISYYMNEGCPVPMVFMEEKEIAALMEELENAPKDADSFDIVKSAYEKISKLREEENEGNET